MPVDTKPGARIARLSAEFLVIVVGVVVALAADRWIANADERADAEFYRQQLEFDLRADSVLLSERTTEAERKARVALVVLRNAIGIEAEPPTDAATVAADFKMVGSFSPLDYNRATWDELVSSGRVPLIRDPAMRRALAGYYDNVEAFSQTENEWDVALRSVENRATLSSDPMRHLVLWNAAFRNLGIELPEPPAGSDFSGEGPLDSDFAALMDALRARPAFQQELAQARLIWSVALYSYAARLAANQALLTQLLRSPR